MGKTYIDAVKYMVYADVEIDGVVEKPDVVGAIFGQTEGLLGNELDLRELQKSGRIGRIEVELKASAGKSKGKIKVPSSLDKVQTSLIAAALETVDKVGPCNAKLKIEKVEDTRADKRNFVVDRAKKILSSMGADIPESMEMTGQIRDDIRTAEVEIYGKEKLAAGPNIDAAPQLIVVEGRADVLQLLKHDIKNVIGMQGKKVPQTVIDLSKNKEIILFIDGDRGGELIVKEFVAMGGDINFLAKAPPGREVEELTQKEILQALRKKISFDVYEDRSSARGRGGYERSNRSDSRRYSSRNEGYQNRGPRRDYTSGSSRPPRRDSGYQSRNDVYDSRDRAPRRDYNSGPPKRDSGYSDRGPRRDYNSGPSRPPRRDSGYQSRNDVYDSRDRAPRRDYNSGPPKRDSGYSDRGPRRDYTSGSSRPPRRDSGYSDRGSRRPPGDRRREERPSRSPKPQLPPELHDYLKNIKGSKRATVFNNKMLVIEEIPTRGLVTKLEGMKDVHSIILDGIVSERLVKKAEEIGAKYLMGIKRGRITTKPKSMEIICMS